MQQIRLVNLDFMETFGLIVGLATVLSVIFWLAVRWKKKALNAFGKKSVISPLIPERSKVRPTLKFLILLMALSFIIVGIANPQTGSKVEEVKREGVDLIIALDLSNSMLAEDIKPDRLTKSLQSLSKLIDKLTGDRIGIVVFGGEAFVQLPITTDYAAAKLFISTISTDIMPAQGTAIGEAIDLATKSFGMDENKPLPGTKNRAVIIITDGENHEDDALEAAKRASEMGIIVHTIGMGLVKGGPIPIYKNGTLTGYKKDNDGNTVITKLNEPMLQQIAAAGNGTYIRANNIQTGLSVLFSELNKMEKVKFGSTVFTDYEDRFQYFLLPALFLLLLEYLISDKKNKYLRKLNLFETK